MTRLRRAALTLVVAGVAAADVAAVSGAVMLVRTVAVADVVALPARAGATSTSRPSLATEAPATRVSKRVAGAAAENRRQRHLAAAASWHSS
jgi:hypothetical protein